MCRNNAVCVMKGPVSTNVGMSSQTIFISILSFTLNSDKDPRSHKDFNSSYDLFSELLIDRLVWTHCVKVKHTHGCSPRHHVTTSAISQKIKLLRTWIRTQVNTSSTETNWFTQVWKLIWCTKDNVQDWKKQTNTTFPTFSFISNMFCWLITQLSSY